MPDYVDLSMPRGSDGVVKIALAPPQNVGGLGFRFVVAKRIPSSASGYVCVRSCDSGYGGGESGITVLDSGQGIFQITSPTPEEMSGRPSTNYPFQFESLNSGQRGPLTIGYLVEGSNLRQ